MAHDIKATNKLKMLRSSVILSKNKKRYFIIEGKN